MPRRLSLRKVLSAGTLAVGAAFGLIFACAAIQFEAAWMDGQTATGLDLTLGLIILGVSGAMVILTLFAGAFFEVELLGPLAKIRGMLSGGRRQPPDLALRTRLADWHDLARELKGLVEAMASGNQALEAENARRRRSLETLVAALEDTSILYRDLQQAYRDLADLKALDKLRRGFTNAVSHELRTPLTIILGYTEFLEDQVGGELSDSQQEFVVQIRRSARRLEFLVNDLLDYAAIEAGTFHLRREHVDISDQIREVAQGFSAMAAERSVDLEVVVPEEPASVLADPRRIGQVVANLIHNALKFTSKGGKVRVALRDAGDALVCTVEDSGIGIGPDDVHKLFKSFSQLEAGRLENGTGLGLAICKSIVEAHGGEIGVDTSEGAGSTFWFKLRHERHGIHPDEMAALPAL